MTIDPTHGNRSPLTFYLMGRPAALYIEALARRRPIKPHPGTFASSPKRAGG